MLVDDKAYCLELARRAVSRAALHLGCESMTADTLDVLADVLLAYLRRLGSTMAQCVEASGRSSAHVNVLDAIQAVELVASPALQRLHLSHPQDRSELLLQSSSSTSASAAAQARSAVQRAGSAKYIASNLHTQQNWQGLASFCFGPNWLQDEDETITNASDGGGGAATTMATDRNERVAGGGKQGPSAVDGSAGISSGSVDPRHENDGGWQAPYLGEVAAFPIASDQCANPHALRHIGHTFHQKDTKNEISMDHAQEGSGDTETEDMTGIPDLAFTADLTWGSLIPQQQQHLKRKADAAGLEGSGNEKNNTESNKMDVNDDKSDPVTSPPPAKKVKIEESDKAKAGTPTDEIAAKSNAKSATATKKAATKSSKTSKTSTDTADPAVKYIPRPRGIPDYAPSFYPVPPQSHSSLLGRTVVDEDQELDEAVKSSSLDGVRSSLVQLGNSAAPTGASYWGSGWDDDVNNPNSSTEKDLSVPLGRTEVPPDQSQTTTAIVPLGRASGSRVSRILEGSMDAAAMT